MTVHIGRGEGRRAVAPDDLDRVLDEIEEDLTEPTLVRLTVDTTTMHVGLGHPDGAVVLLLDAEGRCWHSLGGAIGGPTSFRHDDDRRDFDPRCTVPHRRARVAATEFARTGHRPISIRWEPEPSSPAQ